MYGIFYTSQPRKMDENWCGCQMPKENEIFEAKEGDEERRNESWKGLLLMHYYLMPWKITTFHVI